MRGMKHIPVDRTAGAASYAAAVDALRAGEIVGVFPEATISRSFELKEFKTGAARMAAEAGVPILPRRHLGLAAGLDQGPPARGSAAPTCRSSSSWASRSRWRADADVNEP